MSRRNLERMPLRALSDSEGEEDTPNIEDRSRLVRSTRSSSAIYRNSIATSSTSSSHYLNSNNHGQAVASLAVSANSSSANHSDYHNNVNNGLNSSQLNRSLVQESTFDKIRWAVWGYIYLKIISWISFDVWLLSRLRGSKKVFLLFLPLLVYLSYCAVDGWIDFSSLMTFINSSFTTSSEGECHAGVVLFGILGSLKTGFTSVYSVLPSLPSLYFLNGAIFGQREESSVTQEQSFKLSVSPDELELLVERILDNQKYQGTNIQDFKSKHLQEELTVLRLQVTDLRQQVTDLQQQVLQQFQSDLQRSSSSKDIEELSAEHEILNKKLKILEEQLVSQKLDTKEFIASFEKHIVAAFRNVVNGDKTSPYYFFSQWLHSKSEEFKLAIENLRKEILDKDANSHKVIEGLVRHYVESMKVSESFETHVWDSRSEEDVKKIVREAISLYDADKTGLVDYALESSGGSVISIRCSESYDEKRGMFSRFGLPLWTDQNSPRIAIQPEVHPGKCWSFKGSQGFLVIQFSYAIEPTGFTLEHIPASISPTGSIDSAPREFSVWALSSEKDVEGTLLGQYSYDDKGEPMQYFTVQNTVQVPISYVELQIHSNHGNLEYTCLYRFRVHGTRV